MIDYKLQNVLIGNDQRTHDYPHMYVRTSAPLIFTGDGALVMPAYNRYGFDTYFGGLSTRKWNEYADVAGFKLHLRARGSFDVRLTYFVNDLEYDIASRNTCYMGHVDTRGEMDELVFPYPDEVALAADMVAFELVSTGDSALGGAWYTGDVDEGAIRDVRLNIVTPTFKKEEFVERNVALFEGLLRGDEDIARGLTVTIVDNGRTLGDSISSDPAIKVLPSPNCGGAGGFSRGMIEALHEDVRPTHLLVMDDDVIVSPESLIRTYNLMRIVSDEYSDAFLSGAMLSMQLPDHQVEDIGNVHPNSEFRHAKWERNLSDLNHVVSNETVAYNRARQYAGFWYCCFPLKAVEEQGMCLPLFVRCDDIEFNIRDPHRKYMTMNGICVWHMDFGKAKFNAFNECYLSTRNVFILKAVSENCEDVDIYGFFQRHIETELRKFNYAYAELMCDAVEDYLRGPEWLASQDPAEILARESAKKPKMEEFEQLPPEVCDIWESQPLPLMKKLKMKLTHNGHVLCGEKGKSDRVATMTSGWRAYHGDRIFMRREIWLVNDDLRTGFKTRIDKKRYKDIKARMRKIDKELKKNGDAIAKAWKDARGYLSSEEFWTGFLGLDMGSEQEKEKEQETD